MNKELTNIFGSVFLRVKADTQNKWVHNDWIGYLTMENVKKGALAYLEVVKDTGLACVLNDNSKVLGSWDHSIEWVKDEWEPLAAKAGIRHFALIVSQNSLTESSATAFEKMIEAFEVKVFHDKDKARQWLKFCSAK
jgi:hypothetical protein